MNEKIAALAHELALPYDLIHLQITDAQFCFRLLQHDLDQTDFTIEMGGIPGTFGIVYRCNGMACDFRCDITVGNVYDFFHALKSCYECLEGTAILQDYSGKRSKLSIAFLDHGHCRMEGLFFDGNNHYNGGICFSMDLDQTYIPPMLAAMSSLFSKIETAQGHNSFY